MEWCQSLPIRALLMVLMALTWQLTLVKRPVQKLQCRQIPGGWQTLDTRSTCSTSSWRLLVVQVINYCVYSRTINLWLGYEANIIRCTHTRAAWGHEITCPLLLHSWSNLSVHVCLLKSCLSTRFPEVVKPEICIGLFHILLRGLLILIGHTNLTWTPHLQTCQICFFIPIWYNFARFIQCDDLRGWDSANPHGPNKLAAQVLHKHWCQCDSRPGSECGMCCRSTRTVCGHLQDRNGITGPVWCHLPWLWWRSAKLVLNKPKFIFVSSILMLSKIAAKHKCDMDWWNTNITRSSTDYINVSVSITQFDLEAAWWLRKAQYICSIRGCQIMKEIFTQ